MKAYPFIAAEEPTERNVARTCVLLSVSRSAYYTWARRRPSAHTRKDEVLRAHIRRIHAQSRGTYGAPRVHQQLRQEGMRTARKRVARVMAEDGLWGRQKRRTKRTTIPDAEASAHWTDLVSRDFAPAKRPLNTAWAGDITYLRTGDGWAYLATVIDLASRRVVGFRLANHMRASLAEDALTMALELRCPAAGLIFHSDRGSQYTARSFRDLLARHQIRQSLGRPGQCWDKELASHCTSWKWWERKCLKAVVPLPPMLGWQGSRRGIV